MFHLMLVNICHTMTMLSMYDYKPVQKDWVLPDHLDTTVGNSEKILSVFKVKCPKNKNFLLQMT